MRDPPSRGTVSPWSHTDEKNRFRGQTTPRPMMELSSWSPTLKRSTCSVGKFFPPRWKSVHDLLHWWEEPVTYIRDPPPRSGVESVTSRPWLFLYLTSSNSLKYCRTGVSRPTSSSSWIPTTRWPAHTTSQLFQKPYLLISPMTEGSVLCEWHRDEDSTVSCYRRTRHHLLRVVTE